MQNFTRDCLPPFHFVLCKMQRKKKTYQQVRVGIQPLRTHGLLHSGQGKWWLSVWCVALWHEALWLGRRHLLVRKMSTRHASHRQRRQQGESQGLAVSEPLGRNPSFCQGGAVFQHLYLSPSEITANQLNRRNFPRCFRMGYLLHTSASVSLRRQLWYRCSSTDNKRYK